MRRSTTALIAALSSLTLMACEDGPNQTYTPAPAGAGDLMNNGGVNPSVDPSRGSFGDNYAGRSKQEICSADEKRAAWAKMLIQDVVPPRKYAGLDMAGGEDWHGLTVEEAEKANCQSVNDGDGALHWGDNAEVQFFYDIGTHIVSQMQLNVGYQGKFKFKGRAKPDVKGKCYDYTKSPPAEDASCPHKNDSYEIGIGGVITKNGKPFIINWAGADEGEANITELYDGAIATLLPAQASDPLCGNTGSGQCLQLPDAGDGTGIFGFRPLVIYFIVRAGVPQPLPSSPFVIYNFFAKNEPYSNAPMIMKIDAEGPVAKQKLGPNQSNCDIRLGTTYSDFLATCINVSGDKKVDDENYAKLIGGRLHTYDDMIFNVVGVNNNFTLAKGTYDVVQDGDLPAASDQVTEWVFDVRAKGKVSNDFTDNDPAAGPLDLHGTGLVFREYAQLVQDDLNRLSVKYGKGPVRALGDAACFSSNLDPAWRPPTDCTGFEGMIIPGPKYGTLDNITIGGGPYTATMLKPGDPKIRFCSQLSPTGTKCYDPMDGPVWDTSYDRVIQFMGKGDVFNLPPPVRDRRYFFRWYSIALIKYLKAYGAAYAAAPATPASWKLTPAQVHATQLNLENIFFEVSDIDSFDKVEYVERDFVDATHEPTNFEYGTDVKVGNQRTTQWDRKMSRAERAMYQALLGASSDPLGKIDDVKLTNLFGSPILPGTWESVLCAAKGDDPQSAGCPNSLLPAYAGDDDLNYLAPAGSLPGSDSTGQPVMLQYEGAWHPTIFHQGDSPILINGFVPYFEGAKVSMPQYSNPYDRSSQLVKMVDALVPSLVKQPGVGFNVPLSGTRDKFISSGNLDFSGNTSTYEVKYDWVTCQKVAGGTFCGANTEQYACPGVVATIKGDDAHSTKFGVNQDLACTPSADPKADPGSYCCPGANNPANLQTSNIRILAIDTRDFLGDIFVCQDPNTGDILRARMYDSAQGMLDWIAQHPGTVDACDMIVRYAPFNNYIDKIFSRANGVSVDISKSQNSGRVDDAMLWDPVLAAQ